MRRIDGHLAAALALAGVLAGAAAVTTLASALALTCVFPGTVMRGHLGHVIRLLFFRERDVRELRAGDQAARYAQHDLAEITTIHSHCQSPPLSTYVSKKSRAGNPTAFNSAPAADSSL